MINNPAIFYPGIYEETDIALSPGVDLLCDANWKYLRSRMAFTDASWGDYTGFKWDQSNTAITLQEGEFFGKNCILQSSTVHYLQSPAEWFPFELDGDFTIELWIRLLTYENLYRCVMGNIGSDEGWGIWVYPNNASGDESGIRFTGRESGASTIVKGPGNDFPLGEWVHVAVTRAGDQLRLFIRGQLVDQVTTPITAYSPSARIRIGNDSRGSYGSMNVYIANTQIYDGVALYTSNFTPSKEFKPLCRPASMAELMANKASWWYDFSDLSTMYTDIEGTIQATTNGDAIAHVSSKGTKTEALVVTSLTAAPLYDDTGTFPRLVFDGSNDRFFFNSGLAWPGFTGNAAHIFIGTEVGLLHGKLARTEEFYFPLRYFPHELSFLIVIYEGLTADQIEVIKEWGSTRCGGNPSSRTDFTELLFTNDDLWTIDVAGLELSGATSLSKAFYDSGMNRFDLKGTTWDTSACTSFFGMFRSAPYLKYCDVSTLDFSATTTVAELFRATPVTTIKLGSMNLSSCTTVREMFWGCSSLPSIDGAIIGATLGQVTDFRGFMEGCDLITSFDISDWDMSSATTCSSMFEGSGLETLTLSGSVDFSNTSCTTFTDAFLNTNLTQQTIDNILVAIESNGTSSGTFTQSGGNAPSSVGEAAIDALRLRGWTVTVTGGY